MPYYIGFDCGGTKTVALITDGDGNELGVGQGGTGNIAVNDDETLVISVRTAFRAACERAGISPNTSFASLCAGAAGYSYEHRRSPFLAILRSEIRADRYTLVPDYLPAFWGATEGEPGIVVIAGTGAVAFGRSAEGKEYRADGLGFLLGDKGSGFNLGLYALRHALERIQKGEEDSVTRVVKEHTGTEIVPEVIHWLYEDFTPARVAAIAPRIGTLSEEGDPVARTLVVEMARRLRQTVRQVRHHLWLPREAPIYPIGGLWELGTFFRSEFQDPHWLGEGEVSIEPEALAGGRFNVQPPRHTPAYGATLMARNSKESE
ncbi:MAG: hypothetical protein NT023_09750 [Armatimonadetes bacterium]|nr:hypothetical protein [Armatimonadota bacterium]